MDPERDTLFCDHLHGLVLQSRGNLVHRNPCTRSRSDDITAFDDYVSRYGYNKGTCASGVFAGTSEGGGNGGGDGGDGGDGVDGDVGDGDGDNLGTGPAGVGAFGVARTGGATAAAAAFAVENTTLRPLLQLIWLLSAETPSSQSRQSSRKNRLLSPPQQIEKLRAPHEITQSSSTSTLD